MAVPDVGWSGGTRQSKWVADGQLAVVFFPFFFTQVSYLRILEREGVLDCSVLAFVDTYPTVCSYLFRQISLSRDHSRFFSLALSLFVEEAFWPRYARIQQSCRDRQATKR
jgi:hypothetical protein